LEIIFAVGEVTEIMIALEVTGEFVKHGEALEIIITATLSLLVKVEDVKMALLVPTLIPLTFH
jgi:hypothetical protein